MQELDPRPRPATAPAARLRRLLHGGLPWAVADESVHEVVGTERLQRNPRGTAGSPYGWLLGDREEIPVFLPAAIGLETRTGGAVVVLQPAAGPRCGLAVDAALEVREEPVACLRLLPAPAFSCSWAFPRIVLWPDGLALEIAPEAVPCLAAANRGAARPARATVPPAAGPPRFAMLPLTAAASGLVVFALPALPGGGGLSFALLAAQVVEVISVPAVRPVPGAPETFLGLCVWRGEPLPVLDLALAVGLPSTLPRGAGFAHGLVARAARSRQLIVVPVERIGGVRPGPFPQAATAAPPFPGARRVLGAFASGEQTLVIPDLDGALRASPAEPHAASAASGWR
jgi:chemotaxis signal transduction protein